MDRVEVRQTITAEFMGTFFLVLMGCGAVAGGRSAAEISVVFGLIVMIMIYSFGNVSGAHFNPAVSVGFAVAGRMPARRLPIYLTAQFLGALAAAALLLPAFPEAAGYGAVRPAEGIGPIAAGVYEFVFTFLLMLVILNVSTGHQEKGIMAGVAIGASVLILALVGGPITGAAMNPARALGPAAVEGVWKPLAIYLVAPVLGAAAAAPFCSWIQRDQCCPTGPEVRK